MTATATDADRRDGWLRRNRAWLAAAAMLGALAFYLPWHINQRELDRIEPRHRIVAATAGWSGYEGARWRITGVRRQRADAGAGADYPSPDAALVLVDYEVIPGPGIDARRLDQCTGRLVDAAGREWEANRPANVSTWMTRRGLGGRCGSRLAPDHAVASAGRPFAFTHAFLVPAASLHTDLRADIVFPPSTTRPRMGTYLGFDLPAPRP